MTETARALYFEEPRRVALRERQVPTPAADEVLVETTHSGVSAGTELLVYHDEVPDGMAVDATIDTFEGTFEYPLQYGYAAVGRVTETGTAVDDDWLGRRVFGFNPHETHFCATPDDLRVVPDGIDAAAATLFPTAETALTLVLDAAPRAGERVVVHGAGVVGLTVTALLSQFPLASLTVVDPVAARRAHAESVGATETLAPTETDRLGDRGEPPGMDLAIEVSGNPAALDDAVHAVGFDGRVVVGSWYGDRRADLDLGGHFHRSRIDVSASQVSTVDPSLRGRWTRARRLDRAVDIVDRHDLGSLISHRIPFADAPDAYDLLTRRDDVCHVVFCYD
jgi:2-desacetyl-2-hydroxyethyl bacteriochlorophyllide A dehydrogenase